MGRREREWYIDLKKRDIILLTLNLPQVSIATGKRLQDGEREEEEDEEEEDFADLLRST